MQYLESLSESGARAASLDLGRASPMQPLSAQSASRRTIEVPVTQAVIYGWYDNELGSYTNMLGDRTVSIAQLLMSKAMAPAAVRA